MKRLSYWFSSNLEATHDTASSAFPVLLACVFDRFKTSLSPGNVALLNNVPSQVMLSGDSDTFGRILSTVTARD